MPPAFDLDAFDRALEDYRFADADGLLQTAEPHQRSSLERVVRARREEAVVTAQNLYRRIIDLGTRDDYGGVLEATHDGSAVPLLGLLTDLERQRAEVYLRLAHRWAATGRKKNQRRLDEARRALDQFDLQLAGGLMALLDERFMDDSVMETADRLRSDIEARRIELASLRETERRLTGPPRRGRGDWWRRRGR